MGPASGLEFLTGYIIEYSLSIDNIFLFLMIFTAFGLQPRQQRRVLNWGIIGAMVLRGAFILAGVTLVSMFEWILYLFGVILIVTSVKLLREEEDTGPPGENIVVQWFRRIMPVTSELHGQRFFVRRDGRLWATPMLVILLIVETTDVMFAIDSVPAIFSITLDPFIVYTSNIFAILGLRSLYFFLEGLQRRFQYIRHGVALILFVTGVKLLLLMFHIHVSTPIALGIIVAIMTGAVVASILVRRRCRGRERPFRRSGTDSGH